MENKRNESRKIVGGNAIQCMQNHGTNPEKARCFQCGCGLSFADGVYGETPDMPNGVWFHVDCLTNYNAVVETWGSDSENGENCKARFTIEPDDIETLIYLAVKNKKAGGVLKCRKGGSMVRFESVTITSFQSANKVFSGLKGYGVDRKVTLDFERGLKVVTRTTKAADCFKVASKYLQTTSGKPKVKWLQKLLEIAEIQ